MTIKDDIFKLVGQYFQETKKTAFVPGETYIPPAKTYFNEKEVKSLISASLDMKWVDGDIVKQFERDMAKYMGVRFAIMTNSGSSANLLAMSALLSPLLQSRQIMPGDEVITVACGFPTTVNPIIQNGLVPVFVDINIGNYNTTPFLVESAITEKTRAIFIAHTLGNPYDIEEIKELAKVHNLWVIEDTADALGAEFEGKKVGTFGNLGTTSFYPAHLISTGEGGMVFTDSPLLNKIVRSFRDWGRDCFPAGTKIETHEGLKNIEDVLVGDSVLSHTGKFRRVESLTGKKDSSFVKVKPRLLKEVVATDNHPFFVYSKDKMDRLFLPIGEISKGDFLLEALPQEVDSSPTSFEYTYQTLYQIKTETLPIEPDLLRLSGYWLAEGSLASGNKGKSGYEENKYKFYRVDFTFNKKEESLVQDVCDLMYKYFGVVGQQIIKTGSNGITLQFKTRKGYAFFETFFGRGAKNKHLPYSMVNWNLSLGLDELVKGYWLGDGSKSKQGFSFGSISETLVNQLRRLLLRYEIVGSYHERKPEQHTPSVFRGKTIQAKNTLHSINFYGEYAERFGDLVGEKFTQPNKKDNGVRFDTTYVYYPIEEIEKFKSKKPITVYNFEVEVDNSYHANGFAVHNCWCLPGKDNTCGLRYCQKSEILQDLPEGYDHKYVYSHIGYNLKSTDLQASIGIEQLKKLPDFLEDRRANWEYLRHQFQEKGLDKYFILPTQLARSNPAWFGFLLTLKSDVKFSRTELLQFLEDNKIGSRLLFGGNLTKQPAYFEKTWRIADEDAGLPHSNIVMQRTFWIGCHPSMTKAMLDYIIAKFMEFISTNEKIEN